MIIYVNMETSSPEFTVHGIVYRIQDVVSMPAYAYHILIFAVDMQWIICGQTVTFS